MKVSSLHKAILKLSQQTGLDELQEALPQNQSLGYAKVSFTVSPSKSLINYLKMKHQLEDAKETAKFLQKFWNGPKSFGPLLKLIEKCGGKWTLEISGKLIAKVVREKSISEKDCGVSEEEVLP